MNSRQVGPYYVSYNGDQVPNGCLEQLQSNPDVQEIRWREDRDPQWHIWTREAKTEISENIYMRRASVAQL